MNNFKIFVTKLVPAVKVSLLSLLLLACPIPGGGDTPTLGKTIVGDDQANTLTGTAGPDTIEGRGGNDTIQAGAGNDRIDGGSGNDTINGEAGEDTAIYPSSEAESFTFSLLSDGAVQFTGDDTFGSDTLRNIEFITLTPQSDGVTFNLPKSSASATIPQIKGGDGDDTIVLPDNTSGIALPARAHIEFERINGGSGPDTIEGSAGAETIHGGAGDDTIRPGAGNDTIDGGADTDTLRYSTAGAFRIAQVQSTGSNSATGTQEQSPPSFTVTSPAEGSDTIRNIEVIELTAGDDTITGSAGNDTIRLGDGADIFVLSLGNDTITDFMLGEDKIQVPASSTPINFSNIMRMNSNPARDTIISFELAEGGNTISYHLTLRGIADSTTVQARDFLGIVHSTVSVSVSPDTPIAEAGGEATFTITANPAPPSGVVLNVALEATVSDGAGSWGTQDSQPPTTVQLTASNPTASFTFTSAEDNNDANNGTVQLAVGTASANAGYIVDNTASSARATITDNEMPRVSISVSPNTAVAEAGGEATFTISASPAPARGTPITVMLGSPEIIGAAGSWKNPPGTPGNSVELSADAPSTSFVYQSAADDGDANDGTVALSIAAGSGYIVGTDSATATITDDDANANTPVVSIAITAPDPLAPIAEAGGMATFTITANPAPPAGTTLMVPLTAAVDGTGGAWTVALPSSVMLTSSTTSASFVYQSAADDTDATLGSIRVSIGTGSGYRLSTARKAEVVVDDDDISVVSVVVDQTTIAEANGVATFTITANPAPLAPITLSLSIMRSGTGGNWASVPTPTITLNATTSSMTFTYNSAEDDDDGTDGMVSITLTPPASDTLGYKLSDSEQSAKVTITDNDTVAQTPVLRYRNVSSSNDADWQTIVPGANITLHYKIELEASIGTTPSGTIRFEEGDGTTPPANPGSSSGILSTATNLRLDKLGTRAFTAVTMHPSLQTSEAITFTFNFERLPTPTPDKTTGAEHAVPNIFTASAVRRKSRDISLTVSVADIPGRTGEKPSIRYIATSDYLSRNLSTNPDTFTKTYASDFATTYTDNIILKVTEREYFYGHFAATAPGYFHSALLTVEEVLHDSSDNDGVPFRIDHDDDNDGLVELEYVDDFLLMNEDPLTYNWHGLPKTKPSEADCGTFATQLANGEWFCGFEFQILGDKEHDPELGRYYDTYLTTAADYIGAWGISFADSRFYRKDADKLDESGVPKLFKEFCPNSVLQSLEYLSSPVDWGTCSGASNQAGFPGIGSKEKPFSYVFQYHEKIIAGLYMRNTVSEPRAMGLFNYASGANLNNFWLINANIIGGNQPVNIVGAVVGKLTASTSTNARHGSLYNVRSYNSIMSSSGRGSYIGGLIGQSQGSWIINTVNYGNVLAYGEDARVGGIAGGLSNGGIVAGRTYGYVFSYASGARTGGLVGELTTGRVRILGSLVSATVGAYAGSENIHGTRAGGLVGQVEQEVNHLFVSTSLANASVQGGKTPRNTSNPSATPGDTTGGLIGLLEAAPNEDRSTRPITIDLSYALTNRLNADSDAEKATGSGSLVGAVQDPAGGDHRSKTFTLATNSNSYGFASDGALDTASNTTGAPSDMVANISDLASGNSKVPDTWVKGAWALPATGTEAIPTPIYANYNDGVSESNYCIAMKGLNYEDFPTGGGNSFQPAFTKGIACIQPDASGNFTGGQAIGWKLLPKITF